MSETTRGGDLRVGVIGGDGIVVRAGATIVVVGSLTASSPDLPHRLIDTVASHAGDDRLRHLAQLTLAETPPPDLAVATIEGDSVAVFLYGELDVVGPSGRLSGADHVLGLTATIDLGAGFGITTHDAAVPEVPDWEDLEAGCVQGGGVVVSVAGAEPPAGSEAVDEPAAAVPGESDVRWADDGDGGGDDGEAGPTDPVPVIGADDDGAAGEDADPTDPVPVVAADEAAEPAEPAEFESIVLTPDADLSGRVPLPVEEVPEEDEDDRPPFARTVQVIGVYSPRGFFNHPEARYCSRTGVKMGASHTKVLTTGPRPPLGVITFDDGSTLTVRCNTVLGRDPSLDERVQRGEAAPFVLADSSQSISRRHAFLELVDWDVLISDLGSRNHTYIQTGPDEPRRPLGSGERVVLHSGAVVAIGDRTFVYNEHHVR